MKRLRERMQTFEIPKTDQPLESKLERLVKVIKDIKNENEQMKKRIDELLNVIDTTKTEQLQTFNAKIEELNTGLNETLENITNVLESHKKAIDALTNGNIDI